MGSASAQTVKGTVKDATGEAIIGATVQEKGGKGGAVTDLDGNFSINLTGDGQLTISYVGMKTQTVNAKGKSEINVVLEDEAASLNEVVVIGYGTARKKDLTGAVTTVKGSDLAKVPVTNVAEALTGKLAGVQITTSDGSPDAEMLTAVHRRRFPRIKHQRHFFIRHRRHHGIERCCFYSHLRFAGC